jgi:hypothetical protein
MTRAITITYDLAMASAKDAANQQMRKAGRTAWNEDDYNLSVVKFHRLWPCPKGATCEICNPVIETAVLG